MADPAQARCVVELMILTAWADGELVGAETALVQELIGRLPLLRGVGSLREMGGAAKERLDRLGFEACVREAAESILDDEHRQLAYRCCARVMGADGKLQVEEHVLLRWLQDLFGFTPEDVERLLIVGL